jgi:hypothetical protein
MIKKIGIILISVAIVVTGAFAFSKLHYWERSVRIFNYKTSDRFFEGRGGRGPGDFDGRDSRGPGDFDGRDSRGPDRFERGGEQVPGRMEGGGHGRGDFRGGKKVRLANVGWFLAAFSAFTAASIYFDRIYLFLRRRRIRSKPSLPLEIDQ